MTRAVLPHMCARKASHIINMSSLGGYAASAGWGIYAASKFAVAGLTEAPAQEIVPLGLHATIIEAASFAPTSTDATSKREVANRIDDYAGTAGKARARSEEVNHKQPGDPAKLAALLLTLAHCERPPLRLPAGRN